MIDILVHALGPFQFFPVKRNPAQYHISFQDLLPRQGQPIGMRHPFALQKRKRLKMNLVRQAVVKSAMVLEDLADNPRRGTPADDKDNILPK